MINGWPLSVVDADGNPRVMQKVAVDYRDIVTEGRVSFETIPELRPGDVVMREGTTFMIAGQ
jgi:hypothetical protein